MLAQMLRETPFPARSADGCWRERPGELYLAAHGLWLLQCPRSPRWARAESRGEMSGAKNLAAHAAKPSPGWRSTCGSARRAGGQRPGRAKARWSAAVVRRRRMRIAGGTDETARGGTIDRPSMWHLGFVFTGSELPAPLATLCRARLRRPGPSG